MTSRDRGVSYILIFDPYSFQDEVLAYYEKIVLKLSDLAAMVVHDVSWSEGRRGFTADTPDAEYTELAEAFQMNSYGLDNRDVMKEKDAAGIINFQRHTYPKGDEGVEGVEGVVSHIRPYC